MSEIPLSLKVLVIIGFLILITSVNFLSDHQYYLWIKWTGAILFSMGIILIPFSKVSKKSNVSN
ncbi:hypothetical protein FOH38_22895 [Lysinibacillus fusiformis]|nr:hypothetical protein FOH38_22895 [Lysinibacillus fusiformis]